jgi:hypothetical protein
MELSYRSSLTYLPELLADVAHVTNDFCRDVIHKVHVQTKFTEIEIGQFKNMSSGPPSKRLKQAVLSFANKPTAVGKT